ncbi:MAG: hypothetical protein WC613_01460 [Candidatus Aenigmatarchaeota archaeon]
MGLLKFNRISVAGAFILSLVPTPVYSQDLPNGITPEIGKPYTCEITLQDPRGRPYEALAIVSQLYDGLTSVEVGKKHAYPFNTIEEAWLRVTDRVTLNINGSKYGDDPADSAFFHNDNRSLGWDAKSKKTELGPDDINFFNIVAKQLETCKRQ